MDTTTADNADNDGADNDGADATAETAPETSEPPYRQRRLKAAAAAAVIIVGFAWATQPGWRHQTDHSSETVAAETTQAADDAAGNPETGGVDNNRVSGYVSSQTGAGIVNDTVAAKWGDYQTNSVWAVDATADTSDSVKTAAAGDNIVVTTTDTYGDCWMGGIIGGNPTSVIIDETGEACTRQQIAELQQHFEHNAETAADNTMQQLVPAARDAAQRYAQMNYIDGQPSLAGVSSLEIDGVSIVAVAGDGQTATAQTQHQGLCHRFTVTTDRNQPATLGVQAPCQ